MPELKKRAVASSFILRFPDGDLSKKPQVALFRRSDKVRTYQNKYGTIAGSVGPSDANPLATAWRELEEETTLTSKSVQLLRQGKPFTFVDEDAGREWTVNPFAFVLKPTREGGGGLGEARIRLDWEHSGYKWFDVDEISGDESFEAVPRIMDSLRSIWFDIDLGPEAGRLLSEGLRELKEDRESGARQLASKASSIYANIIRSIDASNSDALWRNVRLSGWHLWKNGRESMGTPILNSVLSVLETMEKKLPSGGPLPANLVEDLCGAIEQVNQENKKSEGNVQQEFSSFLRQQHHTGSDTIKILTLSSSSTITSCLIHAITPQDGHPMPPLDIRVLESRPLFEGVQTARRLASLIQQQGLQSSISIYTDAGAAIASRDIDMVLIGADIIDKSGNVSNKTGSLPAILCAKHVSPRAKIVVVSELDKVLPFDPPGEEGNDVQEVTQSWEPITKPDESPADVKVKNVRFEWIDVKLIDYIITERGNQKSEDIAQRAKEISQKASRFFSDI